MAPSKREGAEAPVVMFREALEFPTVGYSQVGDVELLRSLVHRYPEQTRAYLTELSVPLWCPKQMRAPTLYVPAKGTSLRIRPFCDRDGGSIRADLPSGSVACRLSMSVRKGATKPW
jgi:hypothetical protein